MPVKAKIQVTTSIHDSAENSIPRTRARIRKNLGNQDVIDINDIDESNYGPCIKARFFPHRIDAEQFIVFRDLIEDDATKFEAYIYIRSRILELWFNNVQINLTKEKAYESLEDHMLNQISDELRDELFNRCYDYLERTGKINFGLMGIEPLKSNGRKVGRVIILGAGLSGLTAARQLQKFGLEVIVFEARNRVGGRVKTYRKGDFIADLGPSSLNGIIGNPMVVLAKQLGLHVMKLKQKIPIFEKKLGARVCNQVDSLLAQAVEKEYDKIIEGTRVMKTKYKILEHHGKQFPFSKSVEWIMKLQEKNIRDDQIRYLKSIQNLYTELTDSATKKLKKLRQLEKLQELRKRNHKDKGAIKTFSMRCLARDFGAALKEYKLLSKNEKNIRCRISDLLKSPPGETYLSLADRRLLDWHFAELEYALGCPLNKLSIHYDEDERTYDGYHWMLVNGFDTIVEAMRTDLDIRLETAVKRVKVYNWGCEVRTYQPDHLINTYVEYRADAVLCTLPLGVLQDCVELQDATRAENPRKPQKGYQPVIFNPPLPKWKTQSISRLGCGNLNKIVLSFDKVFWNHELHLFGVVNHRATDRGEFFLFWHHGRTPTLTGLVSGEAADLIEKLSDVEILERCLNVLRSIYGQSAVPAPRDYVVTRWRKDPWAKGAWSYLKTGATGDDYDSCAEPVVLNQDGESYKETRVPKIDRNKSKLDNPSFIKKTEERPRLFFAGEHTSRHHFASAHGAVISGLREAAKIANLYLGCPYDNEKEPGFFIL